MVAALALSACATFPAAAPIRDDGLARLGEATRIGALIVTPRSVVEDSRCPINVHCVWAGRLVVSTRIEADGRRETTNMELGRPYIAHGRGIQLTSVSPHKMAGAEAQPLDYLFGFEGGR